MTDEPLKPQDDAATAAVPETQDLPFPEAASVPAAAPEPQAAPPPEETPPPPPVNNIPDEPAAPQDFAAPPPPPQSYSAPVGPVPLSIADERTWSMLAHLSVLANLLGLPFGTVIALLIYLICHKRSRYVAYQSLQAFVFQLMWWVGGGLLTATAWGISSALAVVFIGFCLMPFACLVTLMPIVALIYGIVAGVEASQGRDFKYWLIGDWVRTTWIDV
ncbi:MAG: hypothetical protein OHK0052_13020 [Anaerolineales bacterium]